MIEESLLKSNYIGKDGFNWWIGQIAHSKYWKKTADYFNGDWNYRCKVRIIGYHPFSGSVLSDNDLPWAQVMIDPAFGSGQGGTGKTLDLKGGETCFGFFMDGDDAQQPVVIGLLHRSDGVKNLISEENVQADLSSGFKPFTGHPGNKVKATQLEARQNKEIDQTNPTASTAQETPPIPLSFVGGINLNLGVGAGNTNTNVSWDSTTGFGFTSNINPFDPNLNLVGDRLVCQAQSTYGIEKKCDRTYIGVNGCQNNLIGQITQALQDFIAFTNGLDKYLSTYIDPVLNEIVDIGQTIANCARQIGGIVKLIINNLRDTIFKCISWAFRKLVGLFLSPPEVKFLMEQLKKYLDIIFCILEKLPARIIDFIKGLLGDLASNNINSPVCAVEQWTAGILAKVMDSIENALSVIMSGIGWLTGGLSTVSGILNQASSLASQIFSFLECTGLACKKPSVWASKFGPSEKEADNWQKMVSSVNVFKGVSKGLGSIEDAMYQTPLYGGIAGAFNSIFDQCNEKVQNPTNQEDIIPLPVGSKYSTCVPPIVRIFGDGIGAKAIPIVDSTGSIFSVEIIDGGFGYTSPPTISIVDNSGCGSGAEANSIIDQDTETPGLPEIPVTAGGTGGTPLTVDGNPIIIGSPGGPGIPLTAGEIPLTAGENPIIVGTPGGPGIPVNAGGIGGIPVTAGENPITVGGPGTLVTAEENFVTAEGSLVTVGTPGNGGIISGIGSITSIYITSVGSGYAQGNYTNIVTGGTGTPITAGGTGGTPVTAGGTPVTAGGTGGTPVTAGGTGGTPVTVGGSGTPVTSGGIPVTSGGTGGIPVTAGGIGGTPVTSGGIPITVGGSGTPVTSGGTPVTVGGIPVTVGGSIANTGKVSGCVQNIIVTAPGYGYTTGDRITDGTNTYVPIVTPGSGAIIGIQPLRTPFCGFDTAPTLTINTNSGVAADLVPIMKFTPTYATVDQNKVNQQAAISGITTVVDCI